MKAWKRETWISSAKKNGVKGEKDRWVKKDFRKCEIRVQEEIGASTESRDLKTEEPK